MAREMNRKLVLEDGEEYVGYGFGAPVERVCRIVFDTSMVGYQEIVTDPSCTDLAVLMTYPLIGNYGTADEDNESLIPTLGALIVSEYNDSPSNFRSTKTLAEMLEDASIPGIEIADTRRLTRSIRDNGSRRCILTDIKTSKEEAIKKIAESEIPHDAVSRVSCRRRWYSKTTNPRYHVVVVDCGIKLSIVRILNANGCNVTVVPYNTGAEEILAMRPDGVFLSDGPGAPEDVPSLVTLVRALRGRVPMFANGLGHQIIALAYGAKTYEMRFGRGGGQPVQSVSDGKLSTVSGNHIYAVSAATLEGTGLTLTHRNLLDGSAEGMCAEKDKLFSVQYQPESASGAHDHTNLFDRFLTMMEEGKHHA